MRYAVQTLQRKRPASRRKWISVATCDRLSTAERVMHGFRTDKLHGEVYRIRPFTGRLSHAFEISED